MGYFASEHGKCWAIIKQTFSKLFNLLRFLAPSKTTIASFPGGEQGWIKREKPAPH